MHDAATGLQATIEQHAALWEALRRKRVLVTTTRGAERAFHRPEDAAAEAARLAQAGVEVPALEAVCTALDADPPERSCLIDIVQALALVKEQGLAPAEAVRRSRVRYQGTDGVRGKVAADDDVETPLGKLAMHGEFTPDLAELLCAGLMLHCEHTKPPTVVVAEDGRDAFGERAYAKAVIRGFTRFGSRVLDLGIAPTPLVPVAAAKLGAALAVSITASHNPADQNGIKFFIHGRKPLPETGDYPLSTCTFLAALEGLPEESPDATVERIDGADVMREVVAAALADEDLEALRKAKLVIDVAHGAFAPFADRLLREMGLDARVIEDDMTGDNINRDSGVAYIEGKERIAAAEVDAEIAIVGKVRALAREASKPVFGIALDADGDRGLLVVYDAEADEVRIIDGDRIAYLLARLSRDADAVEGRVFAGTVESDLAVFDAVRALGIETVLTPVGDKWLSARPELADRLLVGEEASGHLVWPVEAATPTGTATVVTGNGLLTGLRGAAAVLRLGLATPEAAEPFKPGVVKTFYTYFVDRARFYRGSPVWREDLRIAHDELARRKAAGEMPAAADFRPTDFDDDPDMLYLNVEQGDNVLGAIFARNSGTENKTATYARGRREFETPLVRIARAVNDNHIRAMKDDRLPEARAGDALAAAVSRTGELPVVKARRLAAKHGIRSEADFVALVFALTREGRARRVGDDIHVLTD
ncbi:MAG TPA: hypothetical protein VMZ92_14785 [Planctomycetota bacterium]|nr:hypothetical protein [Planctomycetota bacterium]